MHHMQHVVKEAAVAVVSRMLLAAVAVAPKDSGLWTRDRALQLLHLQLRGQQYMMKNK